MKRLRLLALILAFCAVTVAPVVLTPRAALAACSVDTSGKCPTDPFTQPDKNNKCGAGKVSIALPFTGSDTCVDNSPGNGGAIVIYLKGVLKVLGGAVGLVIMLMIILSGVQYITSLGDPNNIKNAKNRLVNAIIALVLFLLMFAIINFLVPGGVLT